MKRFFLLSIFFHCILLLLLFSWETPLANRLLARRIIRVSLVDKIEEKKSSKVQAGVLQKRQEVNEIKEKEILQPGEKQEEKKEERKVPTTAALKEEKPKKDEEIPPQNKPLTAGAELPLEAPEKTMAQTQESGPAQAWGPSADLNRESQAKNPSGSTFLASTALGVAKEEVGLGEVSRNAGLAKGEGLPTQMANLRTSSKEIDATLLLIIRKIEAAKRYPKMARKMGIEGTAVVRFKLRPEGQVKAVEIIESSGSQILDKASLETVRDAAPLPCKEGWLKVGIVFKIL
jgi:TonB family protein